MKKSRWIIIASLALLSLIIQACVITNLINQTDKETGIDDDVAISEEVVEVPTATPENIPTLEPTPTQGWVDAPDTSIARANISRTGEYIGPGPKTTPSLAWKFATGAEITTTPVVFDGNVYFGSKDGTFYAIDILTGQAAWRYQTGGAIRSSAIIYEGKVFFGSDDTTLYALDSQSGILSWKFQAEYEITSSPIVTGNMVYFGSVDGYLYALELSSGALVWQYYANGVVGTPAIGADLILFNSKGGGGASAEVNLIALNLQTGEERWKFTTWNQVTDPVVLDDVVYVGGFGSFYALAIQTGELIWEIDTDIVLAAPAVGQGFVVWGCECGVLFIADQTTGELIHAVEIGEYLYSAPSISDGVVYFGGNDQAMYGVDLLSGKVLWRFDTGGSIVSSPLPANGWLFFGSDDGYLYAVK